MRTIAAICLVVSLSIMSGSELNAQMKHDHNLQPLDWLTQGTWTAQFKTPDGKPFLIQNEIRWADTGTAIYFQTRFNGEPHYYGIYIYDPAAKKIRFFYTSSDSEYVTGSTEPSPSGLKQQFDISDEHGTIHYSSTLERVGENGYDFSAYREGDDKPMVSVKYVRK